MKNIPPIAFRDNMVDSHNPVAHSLALKLGEMQVFEFGEVGDVLAEDVPQLHADLWIERRLRLPFPACLFRMKVDGVRCYVFLREFDGLAFKPVLGKATLEPSDESQTVINMVVASQLETRLFDGFQPSVWSIFDFVKEGLAIQFGEFDDDHTVEENQAMASCFAKLTLELCMMLNTKGVERKHEPQPHRLNAKRARSGKPPLTSVTYVNVDAYVKASGHKGGGGGTKSMHLRRGHIRRYDDGSTVWVRDTIVKADGQLKQRERYEIHHKEPTK